MRGETKGVGGTTVSPRGGPVPPVWKEQAGRQEPRVPEVKLHDLTVMELHLLYYSNSR